MAKTENLGLNLTEDDSTSFKVWRESIDGNGGEGDKSNMQIIDEAFGKLDTVFIGTNEQYEEMDAEGKIPDGTLVFIVDDNAGTSAVLGKAILGKLILGKGE